MRWWLNTDNKAFSYENALVLGVMDFSALASNIWMVQWIDGRGEIEYQDAAGNNLNGLRENFTDLTPWVPYFQQFMTFLPGITLEQAQKIQNELIAELAESKGEQPYHHVVAAGDYHWEATDKAMTMMAAVAGRAMLAWSGGISLPPIETGVPVSLSALELHDILDGILTLRAGLQTTEFTKIAEVNALTSIPAVIAYDVTAGW